MIIDLRESAYRLWQVFVEHEGRLHDPVDVVLRFASPHSASPSRGGDCRKKQEHGALSKPNTSEKWGMFSLGGSRM